MPSTLQDFGRTSARYGEIPFYYSFPIKFWFNQSMIVPEDVLTWCRENCEGYYKVVCYTHEDSVRNPKTKAFEEKIMYVDKIYLTSEQDAALIKLTFEVKDQRVMRPRLVAKKSKPKKTTVAKLSPTSPEAIAAATRRHAAKHKPRKPRAKK